VKKPLKHLKRMKLFVEFYNFVIIGAFLPALLNESGVTDVADFTDFSRCKSCIGGVQIPYPPVSNVLMTKRA